MMFRPCAPLSSILLAIKVQNPDFVSIATGTNDDLEKIDDVLSGKKVKIKVRFKYAVFSSLLLYYNFTQV